MHCTSCGAEIADGARYCSSCGASLSVAAAQPAKAQPPRTDALKGCAGLAVILGLIYAAATCAAGGGKSDQHKAADAAKAIEDKRKGFHCLSAWDGSNDSLVEQVKATLRDPASFEEIETKITPVKDGKHMIIMTYRAKNGFGGMNVGSAIGTVDHESCKATLVSAGDG